MVGWIDQGIPSFKVLTLEGGSVYTAGLPVVCTAPDHSVLYEWAGKNEYQDDSLRKAIYQAIDIFRNRQRYQKNTSSPLRKQYYDKGEDNEKLDLTVDEER